MKCRLEEEYEEGDVTMTWYFNDVLVENGDRYMITFDGTYATLFVASCTMDDMGSFKVVFENKSGTDESTGKVTVKPVRNDLMKLSDALMNILPTMHFPGSASKLELASFANLGNLGDIFNLCIS